MLTSGMTLNLKTVIPKPILHEIVYPKMLDQLSLVENNCIALIAPSGYGKTTLLAQYARNTNRKVVWLTFRESDIEQDNFVLSIQQAFKKYTQISLQRKSGHSLEDFLNQLIGEIAKLNMEIDLVLDHVEQVSHIHGKFLGQLVHLIPQGNRVLMAGYDMSGFPLARMVASGQVSVVSQEQLCFSLEQIESFLSLCQSNSKAQDILDLTEGWPVGVNLYALGYTYQIDVYDLLQDALNTLPDHFIDHLIELSLSEVWSDAIVTDLKIGLPAGWLKILKKAGLPLTPLGNEVFKPHGLLLETLKRYLNQQPERACALHKHYAVLAEQEGRLSCAMKHAAEAEHLESLERYAQQLFPKLWKQCEFDLLLKMGNLHVSLDVASVWWQEYRAVALIETGKIKEGLSILRGFLKKNSLSAFGYNILSRQSLRFAKYEEQLEFANQGLNKNDVLYKNELLRRKASALIFLGKFEEGFLIIQSLIKDSQQNNDLLEEADTLDIYHHGLKMMKRWDEAYQCLKRVSKIYHSQGKQMNALIADVEIVSNAVLYGKFDMINDFLEKSFENAEKNQPAKMALLYHCQAFLMFALKRFDDAFQMMERAEELVDLHDRKFIHVLHNIYLFDMYSCIYNQEGIKKHFGEILKLSSHPFFEMHFLPLFEGLYKFDQGYIKDAQKLFEKAKEFGHYQSFYIRASVMLVNVQYYYNNITHSELKAIDLLLKPLNIQAVCGADIHRIKLLIQYLKLEYPEHSLVKLSDHANLNDAEKKDKYFEILVEDGVKCYYNNLEVKLPLTKSGELIAWMVWHKSGTLYEILNDLWDGSRNSKHHEYFRVLVRRLRSMFKKLGNKDINLLPYYEGRYQLSGELKIHCNIDQALTDAQEGKYIELFKIRSDSLLCETNSEWVLKIRAAIHQEQIFALGEIERNTSLDNINDNISLLRNAVCIQPEKHEFNLALIKLLLKIDQNEASKAFQEYLKIIKMRKNYDIEPQAIYEFRRLGFSL